MPIHEQTPSKNKSSAHWAFWSGSVKAAPARLFACNGSRNRYWHKTIFDQIDVLKGLCEEHGTNLVSASFRWMRHHSNLTGKVVCFGGLVVVVLLVVILVVRFLTPQLEI